MKSTSFRSLARAANARSRQPASFRADRNGREIFYVGLDGKVMAAEVTLKASSIDVGQVKRLGVTPAIPALGIPTTFPSTASAFWPSPNPNVRVSPPLTLIQNWTSLLKK